MRRLGGWFSILMDYVVLGCVGLSVLVVLVFLVWSFYKMFQGG